MKDIWFHQVSRKVSRISRRAVLVLGMSAAALGMHGVASAQQAWPAKPIRLIVGFSAGGPTDVFARVLAKKISEQIGQQVIVENRPGANANIAAEMVSNAEPDGYTFLYNSSSLAISASLYKDLRYDARKDLAPVSLVMSLPIAFVVTPSLPVTTPAEFVSYVKANPDKLNYASGGIGNAQHLGMEMILEHFDLDASHTPYKGSAPAHVDLVSGRTQFMIDAVSSFMPHIREGKLRPIATLGLERASDLPDVPTLHESGIPGFELEGWYGVMAPAKTPQAILDRMNTEIAAAMNSEDLRKSLATLGGKALVSSPQKFDEYLQSEISRYAEVVTALNLSAQ